MLLPLLQKIQGADLTNANLEGANLEGANLKVKFICSTLFIPSAL